MADSVFLIFALLIIVFSFIIAYTARLQQANAKTKKVFNNDYIPPKSPLDFPVRQAQRSIPTIMDPNHRDDINGRNVIHRDAPEKGYVVLNGIKHRIYDCKDL
ncbi:MAG: hypothetical protein MR283_01505 [Erysipelotrichaceae bacterium]|nr:hypothetical protein [Erysipelotrichaceae bacterium]MDY6034439.1 hypothetical protein [Bulleidia sp.]